MAVSLGLWEHKGSDWLTELIDGLTDWLTELLWRMGQAGECESEAEVQAEVIFTYYCKCSFVSRCVKDTFLFLCTVWSWTVKSYFDLITMDRVEFSHVVVIHNIVLFQNCLPVTRCLQHKGIVGQVVCVCMSYNCFSVACVCECVCGCVCVTLPRCDRQHLTCSTIPADGSDSTVRDSQWGLLDFLQAINPKVS